MDTVQMIIVGVIIAYAIYDLPPFFRTIKRSKMSSWSIDELDKLVVETLSYLSNKYSVPSPQYRLEVDLGVAYGEYVNNPDMILISKKLRLEAKSVDQYFQMVIHEFIHHIDKVEAVSMGKDWDVEYANKQELYEMRAESLACKEGKILFKKFRKDGKL
jgi:hypothetical protein|tara:strand:- start:502 stop:978 length:477 start_codon:yes stop_codon:yes gene_type:complete